MLVFAGIRAQTPGRNHQEKHTGGSKSGSILAFTRATSLKSDWASQVGPIWSLPINLTASSLFLINWPNNIVFDQSTSHNIKRSKESIDKPWPISIRSPASSAIGSSIISFIAQTTPALNVASPNHHHVPRPPLSHG